MLKLFVLVLLLVYLFSTTLGSPKLLGGALGGLLGGNGAEGCQGNGSSVSMLSTVSYLLIDGGTELKIIIRLYQMLAVVLIVGLSNF